MGRGRCPLAHAALAAMLSVAAPLRAQELEPPSFPIDDIWLFISKVGEALDADPERAEEIDEQISNLRDFADLFENPMWLHGIDVVTPGYTREVPGEARPETGDVGLSEIWIAGWDGLILHSSDDGGHWERQETRIISHLRSIDFVDELRGIAVGHEGAILRTEDGGQTWAGGTGAGRGTHLSVDCIDAASCWLVGEYSSVYGTEDGGRSWQRLAMVPTRALNTVKMLGAGTGLAGGTRGIWRTEDGGRSWERVFVIPEISSVDDVQSISGIHTADGTNVWAVGRLDGGLAILKSEDAGRTWFSQTANIWPPELLDQEQFTEPSTLRATAVYATSADNAFVVGTYGIILATDDGGAGWWLELLTGDAFLSFHALVMRDARVGWVAGNYGNVVATNWGGSEWVPVHGPIIEFNRAAGEILGISPGRFDLGDIGYLLAMERYEEAWELADRLTAGDRPDAEIVEFLESAYYEHGRDLYVDDRFPEAAVAYGRALALAERFPSVDGVDIGRLEAKAKSYFERGRSLRSDHRYDEAIADLDRARELGETLLREDPQTSGRTDFLARIEYYRGLSFGYSGKFDEASAAFDESIRLDPDYKYPRRSLGMLAFHLGNYELAIDQLVTAISIDPEYESVLNFVAWVYATAGLPEYRDADKALTHVQAALELGRNAERLDTLGAAHLLASHKEDALAAYRAAISLEEEYAVQLAADLRYLGLLEGEGTPTPEALDAALVACVEKGMTPQYLSENVERVELLAGRDPALARRHLAVLQEEYPDHPDVRRLLEESEGWPEE